MLLIAHLHKPIAMYLLPNINAGQFVPKLLIFAMITVVNFTDSVI